VLPLVVVGIVLLIYLSKKDRQNNALLQKQQHLVERKAEILQQYKELEEKMQSTLKEHEELKLAHCTKTQLFQVISGDVGTPLIALKNKLNVLLSENIEEAKFKAEVLELSPIVSDMSLLLENLLQWSKYEAQVQRPNPQHNELSALVQEATTSLKFAAAEKRVTLGSTIEDGLQIYADSDMIKALLKAVLQNAISLLAKESTVAFVAVRQDAQAEIQVQLRGEMPLLELFLQTFSDTEYNSNQSDAGKSFSLGWMFCKSVVADNKGTIDVNKIAANTVDILIQLPV
jgi:K+-sensing histidine kinase KdpD